MKIILSHPTGNANVRAAVTGLHKAGLLYEFQTSIASFSGSLLNRLGAVGPFSEIRRRSFDDSLKSVTKTWPWLGTGRLLASKARLHKLTEHEIGLLSIDSVYQGFDKHVASRIKSNSKKYIKGIYAYEDGAANSFKVAKREGLLCLYDLPIGYWRAARKFLDAEQERWPDWIPTLIGLSDSKEKSARKDVELQLADRIFVASNFTAKTLKEFPGNLAPVEVIPYGFPPVGSFNKSSRIRSNGPLKLLFVGGLSQRKGVADLFAAVEKIGNHVELTVVGRKAGNHCPALDAALAKHNWIPSLPHHGILDLMRAQDVLVFPSLFEGFGLVITEAMSQGTPVITTNRTAGPDLIQHGENGWLIEAGSTEALIVAIEELLLQPKLVSESGQAAMETARSRPWEVYGRELSAAVEKHLLNAVKV